MTHDELLDLLEFLRDEAGDMAARELPRGAAYCRLAADELERLSAIVARLRMTEDGVPITPDTEVWQLAHNGEILPSGKMWLEGVLYEPQMPCYSTREAAEKAREQCE